MTSIKKWQSSFWLGQLSVGFSFFEKKYIPWEANYDQDAEVLIIQNNKQKLLIDLFDVDTRVEIVEEKIWANLNVLHGNLEDKTVFTCASQADAYDMLSFCQDRAEAVKREAERQRRHQKNVKEITTWLGVAKDLVDQYNKNQRWISREEIEKIDSNRPNISNTEIKDILDDASVLSLLGEFPLGKYPRYNVFSRFMFEDIARAYNQIFESEEYERYKGFFDRVEKSPLTREQANSVICFDNRVLSVAAAGSGKTSTLIAKAGYAINKKIVKPEEILLLAFNKDAADEMKVRAKDRLSAICDNIEKISIQTFHAFGLGVIGQATGKKPSIAPWVDQGRQISHVSSIIARLCRTDKVFAIKWGLLSKVFTVDHTASSTSREISDYDSYQNGIRGYRTRNNEVVKSKEERALADWLFFNGITYVYERPYEHETVNSEYRQYSPDFYYPEINAYHEHFALDEHGNAPEEFEGYISGVEWKRKLHKEKGTILLETTSASINNGSAFTYLEEQFNNFGLELKPDYDRKTSDHESGEINHFYGLLLTFLSHFKSNMLKDEDLLEIKSGSIFKFRTNLFIDIFIKFRKEWQSDLQEGNYFDFDDLLNKAACFCENNEWESPYKLVMVDEFQDTSIVRARLIKALLQKNELFLFAVGDDWQSINRFAGADISVMTDFVKWFGQSQLLKLERTFRCPQSICDISSRFIMKNTKQINKSVVSKASEVLSPPIEIYQSNNKENISRTIYTYLNGLCEKIASGEIQSPKDRKLSILFLGRYRRDSEFMPGLSSTILRYIDVDFLTVHSSKGLEADIVILPNMISGSYSFPSSIEDDPVLKIAMPSGDSFPFAEERRLFYVALTRAKVGVIIFTITGRLSPFITELIKDFGVVVKDFTGAKKNIKICPVCKVGGLTVRTNSKNNTKFLGCSSFPRCKHTENFS